MKRSYFIAVTVRPDDGHKTGEFLLINQEGTIVYRYQTFNDALEELLRLEDMNT